MNSERIKKVEEMRNKSLIPLILGITIGTGATIIALNGGPKPVSLRASWESVELKDGRKYRLGDIDNDGNVDIIVEYMEQMPEKILFVTEAYKDTSWKQERTKIMPDSVRVAATRAYTTKRAFVNEINAALRRR